MNWNEPRSRSAISTGFPPGRALEEFEALRESEERLAASFEQAAVGLAHVAPDGRWLRVNRKLCQIVGYDRSELLGRTFQDITHPDDLGDDQARVDCLLSGEAQTYSLEKRYVRKDDSPVWVNLTVSLIRSAAGEPKYFLSVVEDITQRRQAEQDLRAAKEAAEAASRAKDQFLAVLSHELRTPLAPVLATATFLEADATLSRDQRAQLTTIRRNVELEARLIDDLLDLTKISRNKVELHNESVDAHEAARNALEILQGAAREKGIYVSVDLAAARHHVWADPARVRQILWNLLSNAIKFTPPGGRIGLRTDDAEPSLLTFAVTDNGVGIEPDVLPRIFNAFEQGERTVTRRFGGLGLGLTISRALAEMQGGTLTASSAGPGLGATFTLRLSTTPAPAAAAPRGVPEAADPSRRKPLQILLVEDHADTLQVLTRLLRSLGHSVKTADSVKAALAAAAAGEFDLLISDMGLPDGSGLEVMRTMKDARNGKAPPRGIALTGFGTENDLRQSREAGFETHLTKPVDFNTLEAVIQKVAS